MMRPAVDNRAPLPQPHLTMYGRDYYAKKKATTEAAFSDLKMIQSIAKTMTRPFELAPRAGPVSLNATARKQELFRITMSNHQLLSSLEQLKPVVSTRDLLRHSEKNMRYVVNSSHSMRKAGGYDNLIHKYRKETADLREAQLRRWKSDPAFGAQTAPGFYPAPELTAAEVSGASSGSAGSNDKPKPKPKPKPPKAIQDSAKPKVVAEAQETPPDLVASAPEEPTVEEIQKSSPHGVVQEREMPVLEAPEPVPAAPEPVKETPPDLEASAPEEPADEEIQKSSPHGVVQEEMPVSDAPEPVPEAAAPSFLSHIRPEDPSPEPAPVTSDEGAVVDQVESGVEGFSSAPAVISGEGEGEAHQETPVETGESAAENSAEEAAPKPKPVGLSAEVKQNSDESDRSGYNQDDFEDSKDSTEKQNDGTYGYESDFAAESRTASKTDNASASASANPETAKESDSAENSMDAFEQSKDSKGSGEESQGQPTSPENKSGTLGATHTSDDYEEDFAEDSGGVESP